MARSTSQPRQDFGRRAAIYARVSDKSQDGEGKTSISEQTGEMEAYCESKGLTITARYQEVGRGWSKKRPEFQRMLADARGGRFDTIVCWKSDRLSRGMYPAAALMEVVEAHQIGLEAVMDAIDMKTFGLMAAIGKIELDNFRERSTLGKRGTAKQGRVPTGGLPYGYRIGDDGRPEVIEEQAEVVRRIFNMYVNEGMGSPSIAVRLTDEGILTQTGKLLWRQSYIHYVLANATYTGTWVYGKERHISTEDGTESYDQPRDTWIEVPVPALVDEETWERAQALKKQRSRKAKRNTKVLYLLQHLLKCGECGHNFHAKSTWRTTNVRNGKKYRYDLPTPRRYYKCNGMQSLRLRCRERHYIRAERLEEPIWSEVKRVLQNPDLIVTGIDTLDSQEGGALKEEIAQAERDLRSIQMEEDRAIRLFVSGKITETQLDLQRKFITERLESARAKLDGYRAQEASGAAGPATLPGSTPGASRSWSSARFAPTSSPRRTSPSWSRPWTRRWTAWPPSSARGWRPSSRSLMTSSGSWVASGTSSRIPTSRWPMPRTASGSTGTGRSVLRMRRRRRGQSSPSAGASWTTWRPSQPTPRR